ncbi:MAG TPA: permease prefix domain 1-containing protein, partial [Bryobacteraceae bacterium]|nr:permease prefix domain 1-containing protein [Bryobacteraceae bacterium]
MQLQSWVYKLPLRLRSLFNRRRVEQELDDEMRFHLEERMAASIAKGLTPEDARYEAFRAMQGLEQSKEQSRDARGLNVVENFGRDLRYAVRMLRKSPVFTAVAILSLALGIGANTAIFSLIDELLLRPLPVPHPEQLRSVFLNLGRGRPQYALTYPMFEAFRSRNQIFSSMFTWANHQFQMHSGPDVVHVNGALASGDYFASLGVRPVLGRTFTTADDYPSGGKD